MSELYQIYFREDQKAHLFPFATPYYNETLTIYFENDPISKLVQASEAKNIAVASWKLQQKLKMYIGRPRPITPELLDSDYEVLSFTKNTKYHNFYAFGEAHHKGFIDSLRKMLEVAGIRMPSKVKDPIYQNAFSCRSDIYRDYVKTYLIPCMDAIKNDPEVNKLAMMDSKYSQLAKSSAATSDYLMEKIGVPFYPMVPFLLERLFSIYCTNKKINVSWL